MSTNLLPRESLVGYTKYEMRTNFLCKTDFVRNIYSAGCSQNLQNMNDFWRLMVLKSGTINTNMRLKSIGRINCVRIWNKSVSAPRKRE